MDNKNEKTFADLFSSSTSNHEENNQTFDNLLKSKVNNDETNKGNNVTFDNLFDKVTEEESKESNSKKLPNESNLEENEKDNGNPFFENNNEELKNSINLFQDSVTVPKKEPEEMSSSPFFENKTSELEEKQESNSKKLPNESNLEENEKDNGNPFFENNNEELKDSINLFQDNVTVPKTEPEEMSSSPFFENKTSELEERQESNSKKLPKESDLEENKKDNGNPFFENNNEELKEEKKMTSSSPFFEEEKQEENPLFLNKINLVENETHQNKIGAIDPAKSKHFNVKIVKKKEPLFKFILGVLSYALFIWLLLIGITLLVYVLDIKIRAAKGDTSSPTFNAYVVLTGSMLPAIEVYDVVITKKVDPATLNEGDVITFASADSRFMNTIITHRIIKKNYDKENNTYSFQTQGDNNNVADSALVPQNNIYGKVILKIPKLGYLQEFLATDGGWIIVILIPCLVVISYDIVKLAKGLKRKKYKNIKVQK